VRTDWVPPNIADKQGREKLAGLAAPVDPRAKAARALAALPPGSLVSATIVLDEPAFDWDGFRAAGHASQGGLLQSRRAAQRQAQAGLRAALSARGVIDVEDFATVNHVRATITPELASELLKLPEVIDLQVAEKSQPLAAYTGLESQSGTQLDAFFNAG